MIRRGAALLAVVSAIWAVALVAPPAALAASHPEVQAAPSSEVKAAPITSGVCITCGLSTIANGAKDLANGAGDLVGSVVGAPGNVISGAVNSAVDSGASTLAGVFIGAWDGVMKSFLTSWLSVGIGVDLNGSAMKWLTTSLSSLAVFLSVIGVMIAGVWTMVEQRGTHAKRMAGGLLRVLLVSGLGTALMTVLIPATDGFSTWILDQAGVTVGSWQGGGFDAIVAASPGLAIIAGIFGVIATAFQWAIMLARAAFLPLLIGFWPTSAAAAMIRGAEQSFAKVTAWIVAFLLYKPAAAIVYAFAWKLKSSDSIAEVINGLILLCVAVIAMPALLRLFAPATSALGSAFGGGMGLAATGAVVTAGVAAGAAVFTGGASMGASAGAGTGSSTAAGTSPSLGAGTTPSMPGGDGPSGASGSSGAAGSSGSNGSNGSSSSNGAAPPDGSGAQGLQAGIQSMAGSFASGASDSSGVEDTIGE